MPMLENVVAFNMVEHLWHGVLDEPEKGVGYPRMFTPHRRPYPTIDGHVCVLATTGPQWVRLFAALGMPELARDPRFADLAGRTAHIDALYAIVAGRIAGMTTDECLAALASADVPHGPVATLEEIVASPYLHETGFWRRVEHPTEGPMMTSDVTLRFGATPGALRLPPPRLGEHTVEVLSAIGYTEERIAAVTTPGQGG